MNQLQLFVYRVQQLTPGVRLWVLVLILLAWQHFFDALFLESNAGRFLGLGIGVLCVLAIYGWLSRPKLGFVASLGILLPLILDVLRRCVAVMLMSSSIQGLSVLLWSLVWGALYVGVAWYLWLQIASKR